MTELRLIDSYGYVVPGTIHTVSDGAAELVAEHLLTNVAPSDADNWTALGFKADARDYRIQRSQAAG